jgi:hypothetical protein
VVARQGAPTDAGRGMFMLWWHAVVVARRTWLVLRNLPPGSSGVVSFRDN